MLEFVFANPILGAIALYYLLGLIVCGMALHPSNDRSKGETLELVVCYLAWAWPVFVITWVYFALVGMSKHDQGKATEDSQDDR